ncbi:MAG: DNA/RNA nuclease SfsA [Bdellovibrionales bacterium]
MKYEKQVFKAKFVKRYKRFFTDVEIDGEVVVAHCPNTGSMKTCIDDDIDCIVTYQDDPKRKLKYTLEWTKPGKSWCLVNTGIPNKLAYELWESGENKKWKKFDRCATEVKLNQATRADLVMWNSKDYDGKKPKPQDFIDNPVFHIVEVKNTTLRVDGQARFPDGVTTRGQKHLQELMDFIDLGNTSELLFCVSRNDVDSFSPAGDMDPKYAELFYQAKKHGVVMSPFMVEFKGKKEVRLTTEKLKIK